MRARIPAPAYDRSAVEIGIVHFGPGAFHRAHQASYIDNLLAADPRWGISAVSLRSGGLAASLRPQDCLYVLAELDEETRFRVIGALKECLVAPEDSAAVFRHLVRPQVKLVTITVTEKGYCLDRNDALDLRHPDIVHDLAHPDMPMSLVGWLVEGLARRRARGLAPFIAVSCDNVVDNGPKLRDAVVRFAMARGAGDLAAWIAGEGRFPGTMVDSITPATDDILKDRVAEATGLYDDAPVQRESFTQWVIEDVLGPDAPDMASVGVNLTSDVSAYEQAKIRLLNGAHSTIAYVGLLAGHESVGAAMADSRIAVFVERMMREDIAATLRGARGLDIQTYIGAVLKRFRNPALTHRLSQIAADGSKKLPYRVLGSLGDALAAGGRIDRLTVPLAAWMRVIYRETRAGRAINDPLDQVLARIGRACSGEARTDVPRFLALSEVFPPAMAADPRFAAAVGAAYDRFAINAPKLRD